MKKITTKEELNNFIKQLYYNKKESLLKFDPEMGGVLMGFLL